MGPTPAPWLVAQLADRHFCRFTRGSTSNPFGVNEIPASGFCLNAFLVVHPPDAPGKVLAGKVDPEAPWGALGALDPERLAAHQDGWMLPASQLVYGEDPAEAFERLRFELLDDLPLRAAPPRILSEVYPSTRHPTATEHWDLTFVVSATAESPAVPSRGPWRELAYVDPSTTPKRAWGRGHDDIVAFEAAPDGAVDA